MHRIRRVSVRIDPDLSLDRVGIRAALVANSLHPISVEFPPYNKKCFPRGKKVWVRIESFPVPNPKLDLGLTHQNIVIEVLENFGIAPGDVRVDLTLPNGICAE